MFMYIYIYITMLINLVCRKCYKYVHAYQRVALVTYTYIYIHIYNHILRGTICSQ